MTIFRFKNAAMDQIHLPEPALVTGRGLLQDLQVSEYENEYWEARSHASGYIYGLLDAFSLSCRSEFNFPDIDLASLKLLITQKLEEQPERLGGSAAELVLKILRDCAPKPQSSAPAQRAPGIEGSFSDRALQFRLQGDGHG